MALTAQVSRLCLPSCGESRASLRVTGWASWLSFPLPSGWWAALVPGEGTGHTKGSPSFVMLCNCSSTDGVFSSQGYTANSHSLASSEKQLERFSRAADAGMMHLGCSPYQRCEPAQMRPGAVHTPPKTAQPQSPRVWHKVRLECSSAFSPACYFAVANLQNKNYFYLCSSTRTNKELIFQGFSWTCISLASISEGKSWGYSQQQEFLPFPQLIKIKLLLVEKMLQKTWIKMEKRIFYIKRITKNVAV